MSKGVGKEETSESGLLQEARWLRMVSPLCDIHLKTSVNAGNGGVAGGH